MSTLDPVIFRGFTGVNTILNPWELELSELVKCTNFNITKKNKLVSRVGRTSKLTGGYYNAWTNGTLILARRGSALVSVNPEFTAYTTLKSGITTDYISFADCNGRVAWTNGTDIEYIKLGVSAAFPTPTDPNKYPLLAGQLIEFFKGCLLIAKGKTVWQSDPLAIRLGGMDRSGNSRQFAGDITMVKGVDDGTWISDYTGIYFLPGKDIRETTERIRKADYAARKGMFCKIDGVLLPQPLQGTCWAIGTDNGLCIIGSGGFFQNVTEQFITMPTGTTGCMVFNKGASINQIIAVTR